MNVLIIITLSLSAIIHPIHGLKRSDHTQLDQRKVQQITTTQARLRHTTQAQDETLPDVETPADETTEPVETPADETLPACTYYGVIWNDAGTSYGHQWTDSQGQITYTEDGAPPVGC